MADNYLMIAKTFHGLEPILSQELRDLGASGVKEGVRHVKFYGDDGFMYKANLAVRTALNVLKPLASHRMRNEVDLYDAINRMPWEKYMRPGNTLAVQATLSTDYFNHDHYVALKTKDAIVDRLRDKYGERPDVDTEDPDFLIDIHINHETCNVALNSSGRILHKRGYRVSQQEAPLNEVLAAGLISLSGWDRTTDFLDPMCGSGTIAIEAAMMSAGIPPNLNREDFGFMRWPDFDKELFGIIHSSLLDKITEPRATIIAQDIDRAAVESAQANIAEANLSEFIELGQLDFFQGEPGGQKHLVFNPPYDERLEIDVPDFYGKIGDTLKTHYAGSTAWLFTGNLPALKSVGLRTSRKIRLYNGKIDSRLAKYEMYKGSKR